MIITQILSRKNVKKPAASLLFGMAAAILVWTGCGDSNPAGGGGGIVSEFSKGASPVTLANLEENMIFVEGGTFKIGCRPEYDEKPSWVDADGNDTGGTAVGNSTCWPHTSGDTLMHTFYICKFTVTQGLWKQVMGVSNNPSAYVGDDLPVTNVTGTDIWRFIDSLNRKSENYTYRLPSEEEWEYAARSRAEGAGFKYSGSSTASTVAWYGDSVDNKGPHPVGGLPPNELGIHDISGNVWEVAVYRPSGDLGRGGTHFERGGSWYGKENYCGVTYRNLAGANRNAVSGLADRGFRLAADLKP